jgi:hypothetical protein
MAQFSILDKNNNDKLSLLIIRGLLKRHKSKEGVGIVPTPSRQKQ